MKFYLQVNEQDVITDAVNYAFGDYVEVELDSVPESVHGGGFKFINGVIVVNPDYVKPTDDLQAIKIKTEQNALDNLTTLEACAELYETILTLMPV